MNEYITNLTASRNANLAKQSELTKQLEALREEETMIRGFLTITEQIEATEAEKAKQLTKSDNN